MCIGAYVCITLAIRHVGTYNVKVMWLLFALVSKISKATAVTISTRGRYMPDEVLAKAEPG
jgi:hypothetical protein